MDARLHYVGPILDALGIPLPDDKDNRGIAGARLVRQLILPTILEQMPLRPNGISVNKGGQSGHVCLQTVNDGARLCAGTAVRLFDGKLVARMFLFVLGNESGILVTPKFPRRVVRNVEEFDVPRYSTQTTAQSEGQQRQCIEHAFHVVCVEDAFHVACVFFCFLLPKAIVAPERQGIV